MAIWNDSNNSYLGENTYFTAVVIANSTGGIVNQFGLSGNISLGNVSIGNIALLASNATIGNVNIQTNNAPINNANPLAVNLSAANNKVGIVQIGNSSGGVIDDFVATFANSTLVFANGSYVNSANPLPIIHTTALFTGSNNIGNVTITGGSLALNQNVVVNNFPASQNVVVTGGLPTGANNIGIVSTTGNATLTLANGSYVNTTNPLPVNGTVTAVLSGGSSQIGNVSVTGGSIALSQNVVVNNFPASQNVVMTNGLPTGANVIGSVAVSGNLVINNFPATQNVSFSGNLNVNNFPASQNVILNAANNKVGIVQIGNSTGGVIDSFGGAIVGGLPTGANTIGAVNLNSGNNKLGIVQIGNSTGGVIDSFGGTGGSGGNTILVFSNGSYVNSAFPLPITGTLNLGALATGANAIGIVNVGNFPASQAVTVTSGSLALSANVVVNNFPATQNVSFSGNLNVNNFPASQNVVVTGNLNVNNFPASQNVVINGNVVVNNFPTNQNVTVSAGLPTGANVIGSVAVSGNLVINNFPASQAVTVSSGTLALNPANNKVGIVQVGNSTGGVLDVFPVSFNTNVVVNNFPTTVGITNFPATQNTIIINGLPTGANTIGVVSTTGNATLVLANGNYVNTTNPLPVNGTVTVSSGLASGANAIGIVNVGNFPASQAVTVTSGSVTLGVANNKVGIVQIGNSTGGIVDAFGGTISGNVTLANSTNYIGIVNAIASGLPVGGNTIGSVSLVAANAKVGIVQIGNSTGGVVDVFGGSFSGGLPTGANQIGIVNVGNFPVSQNVVISAANNKVGIVQIGNSTGGVVDVFGGSFSGGLPSGGNTIGAVSLVAANAKIGIVQIGNSTGGVIDSFGGTGGSGGNTILTFANGSYVNSAFPLPISGTVAVSGLPVGANAIGIVNVGNFPASQAVTVTSGSIGITGNVVINNFPTTQAVTVTSGSVTLGAANNKIGIVQLANSLGNALDIFPVTFSGNLNVNNFPTNQNVTVSAGLPTGANTIGDVILASGNSKVGIVQVGNSTGGVLDVFPVTFSGNLNVNNFPTNQNVTVTAGLPTGANTLGVVSLAAANNKIGIVQIGNSTGGVLDVFPVSIGANVIVSVNNFPSTTSISNFPATQPVSIAANVVVNVNNFPTTQAVTVTSGAVTATLGVGSANIGIVNVGNFPASQAVTVTSGTLALGVGAANIGFVNVGNFPASQPVTFSSNVVVNNFPASQNVVVTGGLPTGANTIGAVTISSGAVTATLGVGSANIGIVNVGNFPASQPVTFSSNVVVNNFPTNQNVTVTAGLPTGANTIGTVSVTGTVLVSPNTTLVFSNGSYVNSAFPLPITGSLGITGGLPTGANTIGAVTISGGLPTGANTIGVVSLAAANNKVGIVQIGNSTGGVVDIFGGSLTGGLPTGSNTIGSVSVIGGLPTGANTIGAVTVTGNSTLVFSNGSYVNTTFPLPFAGTISAGLPTGSNTIGGIFYPASVGFDHSANKPTLPNTYQAFAASGPWASYVLVANIQANTFRTAIDVENISGMQILVIRDDGTAANNVALVNSSVIVLAGGSSSGAQGGSWYSNSFRGRIQVYAPLANAVVTLFED